MGRKAWTMILGLAMIVASCGGGDAGSGTTEGDTGTTAQTDSGGDTSSDETTTTGPDDADTGDSDSREFPFETGEGFFEVEGERYDVQVIRCIPDEAREDNLDLIGYAGRSASMDMETSTGVEGPGGDANYETTRFRAGLVLVGETGPTDFESPGLATAPDGEWYAAFPIQLALSTDEAEKLENPPIRFDGSNVTGTVQLEQQFPEGETGMPVITYDFDVPGEEVDCDAL